MAVNIHEQGKVQHDFAHISVAHAERIAQVEGIILLDHRGDFTDERLLPCGSKLVIMRRHGRRRAILYGYTDKSILRYFTGKYRLPQERKV